MKPEAEKFEFDFKDQVVASSQCEYPFSMPGGYSSDQCSAHANRT